MSLEIVAKLQGHEDIVWQVAWSPDGNLLASCGSDKTVRVWAGRVKDRSLVNNNEGDLDEMNGWRCLACLDDGHTRTIRGVTWSPCGTYIRLKFNCYDQEGTYLVAGSFDGSIALWQVLKNGVEIDFQIIVTLDGHENEVKGVAWSSDGKLLASCGRDKSIWLWEAPELESLDEFECLSVLNGHDGDVKSVKWHPCEPLLMSTSYDNTIRLWAEDGDDWYCQCVLRDHNSTVWSASFEISSWGQRIVSVDDDCSIMIWKRFNDADNCESEWKRVCVLNGVHERTIYSVSWREYEGPGAKIATGAGDNCISLLRESEGSTKDSNSPSFDVELTVQDAHNGDVNCVAWGPVVTRTDSTATRYPLLASAGDDSFVKVWEYRSSYSD